MHFPFSFVSILVYHQLLTTSTYHQLLLVSIYSYRNNHVPPTVLFTFQSLLMRYMYILVYRVLYMYMYILAMIIVHFLSAQQVFRWPATSSPLHTLLRSHLPVHSRPSRVTGAVVTLIMLLSVQL